MCEYISFERLNGLDTLLSAECLDLYLNSENSFWLGSDGRIYEFGYSSDEKPLRVFDSWNDFNLLYPYP